MKLSNLFLTLGMVALLASCAKETIENAVPVVNAGPSQTITTKTDSIALSGTATDKDGEVVAYLWSLLSGPSGVNILQPGSASTYATGFINGTYVFQLMATDEKGATGVDTVAIVISQANVKTLEFQPANNPNEVALLNANGTQNTYASVADMPICTWTQNGNPFNTRYVLKYDLSAIPAGATIKSANLYLYSYPAPLLNGNFTDANWGTNNALIVQQITANWTLNSITYNNPPATTTANQVIAPHTAESFLDLNLDVKAIVQSITTSNANYGFFLKLQNEQTYTSRIFVSSVTTTLPTKRPKLVVVYEK